MIPVLYDKTGANKIGDLNDCIECLVEEERNGIFELTMVYPANSSILESIVYDNIIVADANDYLKSQKFRVYNTRKLMANRIEVCARHISFDLVHDWVDVISIENQPCEYALNIIFRNSQFSKHFKGHSDIVNAQNFKVNKVTCLEAIGGTSGSIIDTYGTGAEILRDNTDIHVLNRRGRDNDVVIEYRKNLTGLEVEEDTTDLVTRIMPYAIYTNSNNEEIEVRGDFIDSPLINNYAHPYVKYMDYSEKFEDDEVPTKTKLNNLAAKEYINNKVDIPKNNYKIEFIPLSKCAGYEGLEDRINLCDVVTIKDSRYNIDTQAKVINVVFDVLRGRYDSMELGEPRTTLGDIIGGTGDGPTQGPPGPQGPAGADGSIGDFPETLPEVPNVTAKVYGFANIEISWTFENKVYYSYELYGSKTKGFVPNTFNLIFSGQASTYLYQAQPNEIWYFRACALNTHGQRTEFSEEIEVKTVKISDLSNYVESAAISDALIGELNLGRGWYGELRGNYIDAKQMSVTDGNGKRTLDIDSFGNVNLDVTSLKIRANSVATESFVTTAKNDAITSANNTLNTTIANYYTKSQTDSQINVAKNAITQSVSNTYETKTNVQNKIDAIQVGGRNLWLRTKEYKADTDSIWVDDNGHRVTNAPYTTVNGFGVQRIASAWTDISQRVAIESNTEYTLSAFIKWESQVGVLMFYDSLSPQSNTNVTSQVGTSSYKRVSVTFNSNTGTVSTCRFECTTNTPYLIYGLKLEKGNKATDWSPAPEDIETTVSNLTQRVSTAEQKITDTAITNVVKQNFYTKEETNNQITSKGYQTSSQVQQTVDALQLKFTQSGGYNLLRNGGFEHGITFWSKNNNPGITENQVWQNYHGKSIFISATARSSGIYQHFSTVPGKIYSYSFYAQAEYGTWWAGVENRHTQNIEVSLNDWRRYTGTFTATSNSHAFICYAHDSERNVFLDNVIVCEGALPSEYTPHPSEIYDGITTIDKDGINVATSYGAHTQFHSGGMSSYNNSDQRTLGIENGGISFHAWNNNALAAYITQSSLWGGNQSANGLAISTTANGTYLALGTSSLSDVNTTLNMDQALTISANDNFQPIGINFWKDVHAHGYGIRQLSHLKLAGSGAIQFDYLNNSPSTIYEAVDSGHSLYVMGGYQMHLGVMEGSGTPHGVIWMRGKTDTHSYTHWDFHNYTMYNMRTASTYANYNTRRIGESYGVTSNVDGVRYLYRNVELVNGKAIRSIPLEYKGCEYDIVSIVCKGRGSAWVEVEYENRFEINGDCKSVNIEIIIYPSEAVMTASTQQLEEAPTLELPKKTEPEEALLITNEAI